ncbi:hypothetical protein ACH5RR_029173 [Cinchona calisaya]|uniref:DUF4218 domain-containing protein n=1 Tax=Cinchona calisaya TaxID=153742 RepID=A0ABD2YQW8_9GENT
MMHIVKNTCESLLGTQRNISSKTKDTDKARQDLRHMGTRPKLRLRVDCERTIKPSAWCLGSLKKYVHNRARVEGSIAERYIANKYLTFMSKYLHGLETRLNQKERNYDFDIEKSGELLVF